MGSTGCGVMVSICLLGCLPGLAAGQFTCPTDVPEDARVRATEIGEGIFLADGRPWGSPHTAMITTAEDPVVVDVSRQRTAPDHRALLSAVDDRPPAYVILTHGHADHRGGITSWKEPGTEIIAQANYAEFRDYQERLRGFLERRFSPYEQEEAPAEPPPGNYDAPEEATILFDDSLSLEVGGLAFEIHHTPSETDDGASVWIPSLGAAFVGDAYYPSFPNLYTIRGTKPRSALDWARSLDLILSWEPELLVFGHGSCIAGADEIEAILSRYRDAILYVHDATVAGMNAGVDKFTLMREVALPEDLALPETYGLVSWSVRGIYEGYVGWYDGDIESLYPMGPTAIYGDLAELAGGVEAVAQAARAALEEGDAVRSLRLSQAALRAEGDRKSAYEVRRDALNQLLEDSSSALERIWLEAELEAVAEALPRRGGR